MKDIKRTLTIGAICVAIGLMIMLSIASKKPNHHASDKSQIIAMEQTEQIEILNLHNDERKRDGRTVMFTWDDNLEREAKAWSDHLATENNFYHSNVKNEGENLFQGTADVYTNTEMINAWIKEKADFVPGIFPKVAKDGNVAHVGHFTQMTWDYKSTDNPRLGCGKGSNTQWDFLTCKYEPAGNIINAKVPPIK